MSAGTLVATPDPPDETPTTYSTTSVTVPVAASADTVAVETPIEIIDHWLNATRYRTIFTSNEVLNILLDIRNVL